MSPNGDYLALGSQSGTIVVYSVTECAEKWATDVHTRKAIRSLKFSPKDGAWLVSASDDWSIRVWNAETGGLVALLEGHCGAVRSVVFSPDGHYIASTSDDTSLRIWDTEKYTELFCFRDEEHGVSAITFSPDGRYIATGCEDGFVRILEWHSDINVATELRLLDTLSCGASFAPNR
ncbi:Katanin p80 WD40 repeat-containing subunit B1 [Grifola frondosa]|uniref:Katanin p80 WD40 repeat-containing subunit B1 n=1 Tax=Grifola frondosa TaxID=5627 RepID=A0A1C7MMT5_GRIFR|nr:Katanin p80 WD40 repeat-containing subunit B1 [Grifola frondosa]